jgi:hypothetical protein
VTIKQQLWDQFGQPADVLERLGEALEAVDKFAQEMSS